MGYLKGIFLGMTASARISGTDLFRVLSQIRGHSQVFSRFVRALYGA
jgi:hypothetical protein